MMRQTFLSGIVAGLIIIGVFGIVAEPVAAESAKNPVAMLLDGSDFNAATDPMPWQWQASGGGDGFMLTPLAYSGDDAFVFQANGDDELLFRAVPISNGQPNDYISLSVLLAGKDISDDGSINIGITLYREGQFVQFKFCRYTGPRGTFGWTARSCHTRAHDTYDKIMVQIDWQLVSEGFLGIEEPNLTRQ
ncbi:MAG: hypothetical protein GYB68_07730 [Chloroflexi bacterium]|nr:hypothetical protein [Chloroflexota bacterium]